MATSSKRQAIEWARRAAPPMLPDTEQDIFNELHANQIAKEIVTTCSNTATLIGENDLLVFIFSSIQRI